MVSGEAVWSAGGESASTTFAGELFMTLAAEGRLVVDAVRADEIIEGLQRTLEMITARLRVLRAWQQLPAPVVDDLAPDVVQSVVDAVFVDQLAPGQLEQAVAELPKYIEALKVARRLLPPGDI
jgi:hypothetical protein